jgi:hypothetical protein
MSNLGPMAGQGQARIPMPPRGEPIARYETYLEAQRAVDFLSDNAFPVQNVTIVGTGLRMVERVTGRLTYARVALAGAGSGFYFGVFVGLLLSLFGGQTGALLAAPLFGVAFGVLFGVISYAATRGRRDFTSTSQIVASEYEVLCMPEQAGAARQMLTQLPGGTGRAGTGGWSSTPDPWASGGPGPSGPTGPTDSSGRSGPIGGPSPWAGAPGPGAEPARPEQGSEHGPTQPMPSRPPAPAPAEPGLTYGEAIERQRRERLEAERQEAERAERERAERERAERERVERER